MSAVRGVAVVTATALLLGFADTATAQFMSTYWQLPGGIAVSPDGRNVYVTAHYSTLALARDQATGAPRCSVGTRAPPWPPALVAFTRDPATGSLTNAQVSGWRANAQVSDVAISPDSATVYAAAPADDDLAVFSRASNGSLTHAGSAPSVPRCPPVHGAGGVAGRPLAVGALAVAQVLECGPMCYGDTLVLSPLGWLYVGAAGPTAIRWDPDTGELSAPTTPVLEGSGGNEPGGSGMALTPGGSALYVARIFQNQLIQLSHRGWIRDLTQLPGGPGRRARPSVPPGRWPSPPTARTST